MRTDRESVNVTPMRVHIINWVADKADRIEKAYRKSAKSLTDTSSTHAALLHLQHSLSTDVQRADADHIALLESKQASLLLSIAAHTGNIGAGLTNYHSESLRKASSSYRGIEYCKLSMSSCESLRLMISPGISRESVGWTITR